MRGKLLRSSGRGRCYRGWSTFLILVQLRTEYLRIAFSKAFLDELLYTYMVNNGFKWFRRYFWPIKIDYILKSATFWFGRSFRAVGECPIILWYKYFYRSKSMQSSRFFKTEQEETFDRQLISKKSDLGTYVSHLDQHINKAMNSQNRTIGRKKQNLLETL